MGLKFDNIRTDFFVFMPKEGIIDSLNEGGMLFAIIFTRY
jgi:hypothetical protein